MRLPQFEYVSARTLEEACLLLSEHDGARPLAGGTDLLVKMKQRRTVPRCVVNLKTIPGIDYITVDEAGGLRVGALATMQSLKNSNTVKRYCKLLSEAAGVESSVQIRNMATLGGNIANASPAADAPLALIAAAGSVVLMTAGAEREVLLEDFFVAPGETVLRPGEIIREIRVPPLPPDTGVAYLKHAVRRTDIAIVSVAVMAVITEGVCRSCRIGLGSVGPTALRARKAEQLLTGAAVTAELANAAGQAAADESRPIDDIRGYAEYRKQNLIDVTARAVLTAVDDARLRGM